MKSNNINAQKIFFCTFFLSFLIKTGLCLITIGHLDHSYWVDTIGFILITPLFIGLIYLIDKQELSGS